MSSLTCLLSRVLKQSKVLSTSIIINNNHSKACRLLCTSVSPKEKGKNEKYVLRFEGQHVQVKDPSWESPIDFPFIWLRDHCRCPDCYDHATSQRALDLLTISDKIYPTSCTIKDGNLTVIWPDDHHSEYTLEWLWKNSYEGNSKLLNKGTEKGGPPIMWDSSPKSLKGIAKVPLSKYMGTGKKGIPTTADAATIGLVEVVQSLIKYGVAFVDGVPPTLEGTQSVVDQLALIRHTYYGGMFEFGDGMDHMDTAYTSQYIGPHTDNTYFKEAAGLLVLHCIHHEGTGGENFLVDGMRAAELVRQKDPALHACLVEEETEAEYIDSVHGRHYASCGPILRYRKDTGQFVQIRFNLYDRAPLNTLPANRIPKFYSALKLLAAELSNPQAVWNFKLLPGTVMLIDNWRVLHGRNEYTGRRRMNGCYIGHGDFESTARLLGFL